MAHEITLTDGEYAILAVEAQKSGLQPEMLLHEMIQRLQPSFQERGQMTGHKLVEKLYREGKLLNIATRQPLTIEEQGEREHLAKLFAGEKLASDMVIEDRGPY